MNYYSPSNNRLPYRVFKNLLSEIKEEVKWQVTTTRTPCDAIDSGTWVLAQLQAIFAQKIDLKKNPYAILRSREYNSLRYEQLAGTTKKANSCWKRWRLCAANDQLASQDSEQSSSTSTFSCNIL